MEVRRASGKCSGKVILLNQSLLCICGERGVLSGDLSGYSHFPLMAFAETSAGESNDLMAQAYVV